MMHHISGNRNLQQQQKKNTDINTAENACVFYKLSIMQFFIHVKQFAYDSTP